MTEPIILRPGEGRSIDLGTFEMTVKATAEQTGRAFTPFSALLTGEVITPIMLLGGAIILGGAYFGALAQGVSRRGAQSGASLR